MSSAGAGRASSGAAADLRVAVVGGGIAGLSTAFYLTRLAEEQGRPARVDLFEAAPRLGGHLLTEARDGFLLEGGPDCFVSQKPGGLRLARELGIEGDVVDTRKTGGKTFVVSRGALHPLPDGVMLMVPTKFWPMAVSPLLSWPGKLRMGMDLVVPKRGGEEDETLGGFVRRRLGDEALELIAEPLVAGVHAGDPDRLSLRSTFPRFKRMEDEHRSLILAMLDARKKREAASGQGGRSAFVTLSRGVGEFVDTLVRRLAGRPQLRFLPGTAVRSVRGGVVSGSSSGSRGFAVEVEGNGAQTREVLEERYDAVVLAVPAAHAASMLDDRGHAALRRELEQIQAVSAATVNLAFRRGDVRHPLDGFGMVIPRREGRPIMGTTFSSQKFPGRAPEGFVLVRAFVGGVKGEDVLELDDRALLRLVRRQLAELLGASGEPVLERVFRWERAMPQYNVGHTERVGRIEALTAEVPGLELTGGSYRGIGIPDCVTDAERAARSVLS